MKKLLALLLVVSGLMVSCSDDFQYNNEGNTPEVNLGLPEGYGMLSFGEMQISIDESEALVRSTELPEVDGNYVIKIKNAEGVIVEECQYKDIKESSYFWFERTADSTVDETVRKVEQHFGFVIGELN